MFWTTVLFVLTCHILTSMVRVIEAADQTRVMQEQMQMQMQMPQDPSKAFKAEWEALEIVTHDWSLENVEHEMMEEFSPADIDVITKDKYV